MGDKDINELTLRQLAITYAEHTYDFSKPDAQGFLDAFCEAYQKLHKDFKISFADETSAYRKLT